MEKNYIEALKDKYKEFDYLFEDDYNSTIIHYGIINGNNKILFIKPGLDGSLIGYKEKYYKLAKYINEKYGYTVVCSNNPSSKAKGTLYNAMDIIQNYIKFMNFTDYEIYYFGYSNGAVLGAIDAYKYPSITKLLLINPPLFINFDKIQRGIEGFKGSKITFVFGELDPSTKYIGLLDLLKKDNLSYYIVKGEDHNLSNDTISLEQLVEEHLVK